MKQFNDKETIEMVREHNLEEEANTLPELYPSMHTISNAFTRVAQPIPKSPERAEFLYYSGDCRRNPSEMVALHTWNTSWEQAQLRRETLLRDERLPKTLRWLETTERNVYILPWASGPRYYAYAPLYHLLPKSVLEQHGLPVIKRGLWPFSADYLVNLMMPNDLNDRLGRAFASYVWPMITGRSPKGMKAFSADDPLKLLAHSLDFWLPFAYEAIEEIARSKPFTQTQPGFAKLHAEYQPKYGDIFDVCPPRCGGSIWDGEGEAFQVAKRIVELADRKCRIKDMVELVSSSRVHDDFSDRWSTQKIDFERTFYHSRVKVSFVELPETIPVHGPESEFERGMLWSDLFSIVDPKDRRLVVLLRNGHTNLGDISKLMGYKTHSAVSKKLARIKARAKQLLE